MKYLVTGASGFVGRLLVRDLLEAGHEVVALSRSEGPPGAKGNLRWIQLDLTMEQDLRRALQGISTDGVFHLAAESSVAASWKAPSATYQSNTFGTLHLALTLQSLAEPPRFLFASSGEIYGQDPDSEMIRETDPARPSSPYGMSKWMAENLLTLHYPQVLLARPFAHIGPGQSSNFAVANFCAQIRAMRQCPPPHILHTGNLEVRRPFLDVRDAVSAYRLIMEQGRHGRIYNIAGEHTPSLNEIVLELRQMCGLDFEVRVDPARLRRKDILAFPTVACDHLKQLGWSPRYPLRATLHTMLEAS